MHTQSFILLLFVICTNSLISKVNKTDFAVYLVVDILQDGPGSTMFAIHNLV